MSEARYTRVYFSILDDPRLSPFIRDREMVGSWLLLLINAEMAWPSSAELPRWASRKITDVLVSAGCIEVSGDRYRFHGLDDERERRSNAGRVGGVASGASRRTTVPRSPNGRSTVVPVVSEPSLNGSSRDAGTKSNLDETRRDETSKDETKVVAAAPPPTGLDLVDWLGYVVAPGANRAGRLIDYYRALFSAEPNVSQRARLGQLIKGSEGPGIERLMSLLADARLRRVAGDPLDYVTAARRNHGAVVGRAGAAGPDRNAAAVHD